KVEGLYASLGGFWRAADSGSKLNYLWIHKNEKGQEDGLEGWRLALSFDGAPGERFEGLPARIEARGGALRIHLPPSDGRRGTHALLLSRDGDRVEVRVIGGPFEGRHALRKATSKQ